MKRPEDMPITIILVTRTTAAILNPLIEDEKSTLKKYKLNICPNYTVDIIWKDVDQQFKASIKDSEYNFLEGHGILIGVDTTRNIKPAYLPILSAVASAFCVLVLHLTRSDIDKLWRMQEQGAADVTKRFSLKEPSDAVKIPLEQIKKVAYSFLKIIPQLKHAEFQFWLKHRATERGVRLSEQKEILKILRKKTELTLREEKYSISVDESSFHISLNYPSVVFCSSYEPADSPKVFVESVNKYYRRYEVDYLYPSLQDKRYILSLILPASSIPSGVSLAQERTETDLYSIVRDVNSETYFVTLNKNLNDSVFDTILSELLIITQLLCETIFVDTLSSLRHCLVAWVDYLDEWYRGRKHDDPTMNKEILQDIADTSTCLKYIDGSIRLSEERWGSFHELLRNTASKLILSSLQEWKKFIGLVPSAAFTLEKIEYLKKIPLLPTPKTRLRKAIEYILDVLILGFLVNLVAGLVLKYDPILFSISLILLVVFAVIRIFLL